MVLEADIAHRWPDRMPATALATLLGNVTARGTDLAAAGAMAAAELMTRRSYEDARLGAPSSHSLSAFVVGFVGF